ncbi:hypothetical protein DRW07_01910 [Alteromonas sediminis]|uniref:PEP-CTERM sorting domain-containing protein n=1 Tax=Alteromonas sediminis TaxID=2259342 RepID=A0A3N5ZDI9_9ALTE|nr:hypothetical protein [Alteromonas sediminis]RPJ68188.1 hypothetical protein DRW07_01910 [Alteromonas sediminis]
MKPLITLMFIAMAAVPATALAGKPENKPGKQAETAAAATCQANDIVINSSGDTSFSLSAGACLTSSDLLAAYQGNGSGGHNDTHLLNSSDLGALELWDTDGWLTSNSPDTDPASSWTSLGKINPAGGWTATPLEGSASSSINVTPTDGGSGGWTNAGFDVDLNGIKPMFFDQIIFSVKAGNEFALYQFDLSSLHNVYVFGGSIKVFNGKDTSHITAWLRQSTPTDVSAPAAILLLLAGTAFMALRKRK